MTSKYYFVRASTSYHKRLVGVWGTEDGAVAEAHRLRSADDKQLAPSVTYRVTDDTEREYVCLPPTGGV